MSSILDALNKVEQEKAQVAAREAEMEVDPVAAVQDMVGPDLLRDRVTLRFSPGGLVLGVVLFAILLVGISVGLSAIVFRSAGDAPTPNTAAASTLPTVDAPSSVQEPSPDLQSVVLEEGSPSADAISPSEPASAESVGLQSEAPMEEVPDAVSEAIAETPEVIETILAVSAPAEEARVEIDAQTAEITLLAMRNEDWDPISLAESLNIHALPLWTASVEARYKMDRLMVNMVAPEEIRKRFGKPYDYALINMLKIQVGQRIPKSPARLVGVDSDGVVLQIVGSRDLYFLPL